jgi:hypothetical protein
MKTRSANLIRFHACLLLSVFALPGAVKAQFNYTTNRGTIIITKYTGSDSAVTIPSTINGLPVVSLQYNAFIGNIEVTSIEILDNVTNIGVEAFLGCQNLASVTIARSVNNIGGQAFISCPKLAGVYFEGNAPANVNSNVFTYDKATVYYLPGTTGWGTTFAGLPTAVWHPRMETNDASFGVRTNQFGFNIKWGSGMTIVVEASTELANPVWSPVGANTLTSGSSYFSDPEWTNYPVRFYRLRSP